MNLNNRTDSGELPYGTSLYTPDNDEKQNYHVQNAFDEEKPQKQGVGYHVGTAGDVQGVYTGSAPKLSEIDYADISGGRRILRNMFPNAGKPNQGFTGVGAGVMAPVPIQEPEPQNQYKDVLDRALGGSFGENLKQRFAARRQESKKRSEKAYRDAVSVMGGNPVFASYRAMESDDAVKDIEETIAETDVAELARRVAPLAKYHGYGVDEYLKERVLPKMYDTLLDEVLEDERPKNSAEYILRSSLTNSLIGKVALFARDKMLGNSNQTMLQSEGLGSYKASRLEQFAGNVGSLLVDAPVFSLLGGGSGILMGKVANKVTSKLAGRILTRKFGEGMTREAAKNMAERVVAKRLGFKMLQSAGTQGLTLGNYDAMNSIVDDMLYQNDIDAGKAAGSFAKGTLTGAALGVVGTPLREASKGLTGAKKLLASSGVLSAESAVFTAGTELEKLKNDVEIAPIDLVKDFGESAATLLVMRMTHWRPKGASLKLGANGKIKEKFALSSSERAELKELNVNPEQFIDAIEKELKLPSFGGERSRYIKDTYSSIMSNEALSASARAKLLFLVENKVTSTPPVPFDFTVRQREDSKWEITTVDEVGRTVSRNIFDHAGNAKSYLMVKAADFRRNRIALFEAELTDGLRSANFIRQAGLYAKSCGKDIEEISTAVYKKSAGHEMSAEEKKIVDDILVRSAYDEAGMVQMLYNVRRKIEKRHGLEKGTMLIDIHKPFFHLTKAQNNSLDEYEALLRDEVDRLKGGTDKRRSVRLLKQGLDSDYFGMSNDEVKADEIQKYYDWVAVRDADRVGLHSEPYAPAPPRPIYIPPEDNSGYVWSYGEAKNTREDIERYKERAEAVAAKFGVKPHFIFDEREIERPDPEDYDAVARYNAQVVSSGWVNVGRVFINLPNAKNIEDVERTVLHEVVGHKGLMHVFGEHLNDFLEDVYRKASPEVLRGINRIKYQYRGFDNYTVMEEYLAYLAEGTGLTRQERSLYVRIKDYIRSLLIRMNIYTGSNRQISESELRDIMQRHCEYLQTKESPDDYRKDVFGSFNASYRDAKTYYDNALYRNELKSQIDKGEFLVSTPKFFRNAKELAHYDLLPPEQQKRVRERNGIVEEPAQNPVEENMYRRGEKTTSGERSGVIPGNSSSGDLLQVSNGHLSHYALTSQEDVANIAKNTDNSYFSARRKINEGGFYDIYTAEDAVEKTTSGERSGAVPGSPSSGGLILGGSAHLSRYPLAQPKHVANIDEKTARIKYSAQKYLNKGDFNGGSRVQDVVRNLGRVLQFDRSKTSQSYYTDLYINGRKVLMRISTHPATNTRMGNSPADDKISIVVYKNGEHVSRGEHNGYIEYIYDPVKVSLNDAANSILNGVVNLIENGTFVDYTGKAEKNQYPYYNDGKLHYRLPDEEKTTSGERSGAVPDSPSSGGLILGGSAHLSRYPLAQPKHVANIQREVPGSKYNVLKHFDENGEPLPEYYPSVDTKYRLPDDLTGKETRYRLPDDIYKGSGEEERRSLEREALERGMAHDPKVGIPLLEDPFYRSLRANSPTYAYVYEHLRGLPSENWKAYDHDLWNTLVGMAESGVGRFVMKDIVTDKDFLMEHPELAMIPVDIEKDLSIPVMYDRKNNRILLDRRVYLYPQSRFYIDGALRSVARDFEERRNSVKRQLNEFNSSFRKSYNDAVAYARNLIKMREEIPGFDADNRIAEMYRSEFGFMPDEFMRRFPNIDDYLLYRVARSMGHFIGGRYNPEYRKEIDEAVDSKIKKYRSFFWGPVEIIIDAASGAEAEGPLRVATKKDYEERVAPKSALDKADEKAYFRYEFPKLLHDISLFDPAIRSDPTGWEEYKRIRDAKIKAEKEKYGIKVPKTREEKKRELELEKKRLKMN
ncbi:MAG: hypothetical protein E7093_04170 [Bacteroidales bacterium]|nr:hypothetical protein [Bacteroidales bacterium]